MRTNSLRRSCDLSSPSNKNNDDHKTDLKERIGRCEKEWGNDGPETEFYILEQSMLAHWPKYKMKKKDPDPLFDLITILFSSIFYYINLYFYFNPACIIHHEAYFEHQSIIQSYYLDFNKNNPITINWCENHSILSQITNSLIHWSSLMSG